VTQAFEQLLGVLPEGPTSERHSCPLAHPASSPL
jgi:hypothetical protein